MPCDNGIPVTIDELLDAIGKGELQDPSFHNGCCISGKWWESKTTQPGQQESMTAISKILYGYLEGKSEDDAKREFPDASGFIERTYEWLGPVGEMSEVRKLLVERVLLLVDACAKTSLTREEEHNAIFGEGGLGEQMDEKIALAAGLPKIWPNYRDEYLEIRDSIQEPEKKELYRLCGALAHGLHHLSDCHHSTFRWIELWIHAIGTGKLEIPSRKQGTERERLGHLLFGYVYGLDKWLAGKPMQFVLLDLGYIDLGFDPKNEILRIYAYFGEQRIPVKEWLAASLWWVLLKNRPAGLLRHENLLNLAEEKGISLREWIDGSK